MGWYIALGAVGALAVTVAVLLIVFADNKTITYERFRICLGTERGSVRIAHLSDLHFPKQAVDTDGLLAALERENVDLVALTGDLVVRSTDAEKSGAFRFIEALCARFPVWFVQGNHDAKNDSSEEILSRLMQAGVHVLDNRAERVETGAGTIVLAGVSERAELPALAQEDCVVLLIHRPERAARIVQSGALSPDVVLCGHAHGGQFRFFGRGLYAPGQGLFPKYTSGMYRLTERTRMIVSRGIGKSEFPFRFNNRPHVPIITIER